MKKTILLPAFLCVISSVAIAETPTHCEPGETVVFSCSVGKKTASVCASSNHGPAEGYLQYRFGALGNVEMTHPAKKEHPRDLFTAFYATPVMDDGSRAMVVSLEFGVNDYGYEITTFAKTDTSETELIVTKAGKNLATLKCLPQSIIRADLSYMDVLTNFGLD